MKEIGSSPFKGALFETSVAQSFLSIIKSRWQEQDLSGLKAFINSTPHCIAGILAYNGREILRLGEKLWAIPLGVLLL